MTTLWDAVKIAIVAALCGAGGTVFMKAILNKLFKRDCTNCQPVAELRTDLIEFQKEIKQDIKDGFKTVHKRIDDFFLYDHRGGQSQ